MTILITWEQLYNNRSIVNYTRTVTLFINKLLITIKPTENIADIFAKNKGYLPKCQTELPNHINCVYFKPLAPFTDLITTLDHIHSTNKSFSWFCQFSCFKLTFTFRLLQIKFIFLFMFYLETDLKILRWRFLMARRIHKS